MKKYVVINADDFGLSSGTNWAIEKAHEKGILTSASLFATTPGFEDALRIKKEYPKLGLGVHLSLTWGQSVLTAKEVPDLVDKDGYFYPNYLRLIVKSQNRNFVHQVGKELSAQVEKIVNTGIKPDHINSQQHVHMIPAFFPLVLNIAQEKKIKFIRYPHESFFLVPSLPELTSPFFDTNIIKFLLMRTFSLINTYSPKTAYYGLMYTTKMNVKVMAYVLQAIKPGITEILLHPAKFRLNKQERAFDFSRQRALAFMQSDTRVKEFETLTNPLLKQLVSKNGLTLTNFSNLANL